MKIAITGATGFIGMHLVKEICKSNHLVSFSCDSCNPVYGGQLAQSRYKALEKLDINFSQIDISEISPSNLATQLKGADVVIHLAANAGVRNSIESPYLYSKSNLNAFASILDAVRMAQPKLFMFASSSSVYGKSKLNGPQETADATGLNLASYYAATKWSNEILARSYADNFSINTVALRFFTVYGSFGRPDMAYWKFADKIRAKENVEIYGEDGGKRSYSHVSDVVKTIIKLFESKSLLEQLSSSTNHFAALNIGNESSVTTKEMILQIGMLFEQEPILQVVKRPKFDVDQTWAGMGETYKYIERSNFLGLNEGLEEFIEWYKTLDS